MVHWELIAVLALSCADAAGWPESGVKSTTTADFKYSTQSGSERPAPVAVMQLVDI
jgi:hypothetical protein